MFTSLRDRGYQRYSSTHPRPQHYTEVSCQLHVLLNLHPWKNTKTHWTRGQGWMVLEKKNLLSLSAFELQTVQPVASQCTEYATSAQCLHQHPTNKKKFSLKLFHISKVTGWLQKKTDKTECVYTHTHTHIYNPLLSPLYGSKACTHAHTHKEFITLHSIHFTWWQAVKQLPQFNFDVKCVSTDFS